MRAPLSLFAAVAIAPAVFAQSVTVLGTTEVAFTAGRAYDAPSSMGALRVTFTGSGGESITVDGFWDGGSTFRARFAPPTPGRWAYHTASPDPSLDAYEGTLDVAPYDGDDPSRFRGWPRVSADGRHLTYGDGAPLFLLADWAAEAAWRSVREDIVAYLDDRAEKGFAAVQVVVSSHNRHFPQGVTNQYGEPLHPPYEPALLNPRYFDYLDWLVTEANARGLAVLLYPIWAATVEIHSENGWYGWYVPTEAALLRARYVAARYAGHHVIWVIGGDQYYDTPDVRDFWREVGRAVDEASGGNHLITAHGSGWSGSFQYFDAPEDGWLDFHTYTPTHWAGGDWSYTGPAASARAAPLKPLLNIESNFEGLFHRFWDFMADTSGTFRLEAVHAREAAYWGVLSGALAGYSYGANSIWQWTTEATLMEPGDFWPRRTAVGSLGTPGATHAGVLRRTMEALAWTDLAPASHVLLHADARGHVAVAASTRRIVGYLPEATRSLTLLSGVLYGATSYAWIDVRTGERSASHPAERPFLTVAPPDEQDWLLVVEGGPVPAAPPAARAYAAPNPSRGGTVLYLDLPVPDASVELDVFDLLGRRVHRETATVPGLRLVLPLTLPTAGTYLCRLRLTAADGSMERHTLRLFLL